MEPEQKSNGSLVGLVVIIIILVIGGIYIWMSNQKASVTPESPNPQAESGNNVTDQDAAALNSLELDAQRTNTSTGVDVNTVY